jgi:DNA polymerase III alpha subunit
MSSGRCLPESGTTNDAHYVLQEHADAHDNLLCIQVAKNKDDPNRFRFHGTGYYLKTTAQMGDIRRGHGGAQHRLRQRPRHRPCLPHKPRTKRVT